MKKEEEGSGVREKNGRVGLAPLPNPISLKQSVQLELGYEMILIAKHDEKIMEPELRFC